MYGFLVGSCLSFAQDGSRIAIGTMNGNPPILNSNPNNTTGTVSIFDFQSSTSTYESTHDTFSGGSHNDRFGWSCGLDETGDTLVVGSIGKDSGKLSIFEAYCTNENPVPTARLGNAIDISYSQKSVLESPQELKRRKRIGERYTYTD